MDPRFEHFVDVWAPPGWFRGEPMRWREQELLDEVEDMGSGCHWDKRAVFSYIRDSHKCVGVWG